MAAPTPAAPPSALPAATGAVASELDASGSDASGSVALAPGAPVYRADPPAERPAMTLDGLTLVYHRRSRTTHLLASPAPELLAALAQGPADAATLALRLLAGETVAPGEADAARAVVAAHLADLAAAGLVERA